MTRIQLEEGFIDLPNGANFPITLSSADILGNGALSGGFSKALNIAGTTEHTKLMGLYFDVDLTNDKFNRNKKTECTVIQEGTEIFTGYIQLMEVVRVNELSSTNSKHIEYKINVFDEVSNFFISMGEKKINELSFPELNHVFNRANIISSWNNTDGYIYPMFAKDITTYTLQDFKPAIFELDYFTKIFAQNGYTYTWDSLTDATIKMDKRIIPFNGNQGNEETTQLLQQQYTVKGIDDAMNPVIDATTVPDYPIGWLPFRDYLLAGNVQDYADDIGVHLSLDTVYEDAQNQWNAGDNTIINKAGDNRTWSFLTEYSYDIDVRAIDGGGVLQNWEVYFNQGGASRLDVIITLVAQSVTNPTKLVYIDSQVAKTFFNGGTYDYGDAYEELASGINASSAALGLFDNNEEIRITPMIVGRYFNSNGDLVSPKALFLNVSPFNTDNLLIPCAFIVQGTAGAGQEDVRLEFDITITDLNIKAVPDIEGLVKDSNIEIDRFIPKDIKQKDIIRSIATSYNLVFVPDPEDDRNVIIKTRDDYYDGGEEWDWTKKFVEDEDSKIKFISNEVKRDQVFTYKEDSDSINEAYTKETNEVYGESSIRLDNEYINGEDVQELIYAPTPSIESAIGVVLPAINGIVPENKIRVLLNNGKKSVFEYPFYDNILPTGTPQMIDEYLSTSMFDNDETPNFSICFDSPRVLFHSRQQGQTNNYLYSMHHLRETTNINQGKMMIGMFDLSEVDFQKLAKRLDYKIFIKDNGWFYISTVNSYNSGKRTITKVELVTADDNTGLLYKRTIPSVNVDNNDVSKDTGGFMKTVNDSTNIIIGSNNVTIVGRYNVVQGADDVNIIGDKNVVKSSDISVDGNYNVVPQGVNGSKVFGDSTTLTKSGIFLNGKENGSNVIYKARVWQSGTDAIVLEEIENAKGFVLTSSRSSAGIYAISGFDGELFNTVGEKYDLFLNHQSISFNGDVLTTFNTNTRLRINTYNTSDVPADGIIVKDLGGTQRYHILTIKKYG